MAEALGTHYAVIPIEESVSLTEKQLQSATIHDYGTGKDETLSRIVLCP